MLFLTLLMAKATRFFSRWIGRGGGQALPGLVADKLDPHVAGKLARSLPHGVILVTGTNGKTTTTKLIAEMLTASGERVLTNSTGSNLKRGVTSALISAADLRGRFKETIGLFEVDEANLRLVAPEVQPSHIVVLNLFRDQLDRYGELDTTAALIGQGIAETKAQVYLNSDDPLVASLAKYSEDSGVHYFGIEGMPARPVSGHETVADSDRCPVCRARLVFSRTYYGHIGHYRCPNGDFSRPQPDVAVSSVEKADLSGSVFTVSLGGKRVGMKVGLPGVYNLYNALAAVALALGVGVGQSEIAASLAGSEAAFGRVEKLDLEGREVYLLLIKNPAGFTQVIDTFLAGSKRAPVMLAINDLDADGRDVSWLWDVPLELLAPEEQRVVCAGIRAADMALRLKYAGIESESEEDFEIAMSKLLKLSSPGEKVFILPTYTAMLQIRKVLSKKTQIQEVWR